MYKLLVNTEIWGRIRFWYLKHLLAVYRRWINKKRFILLVKVFFYIWTICLKYYFTCENEQFRSLNHLMYILALVYVAVHPRSNSINFWNLFACIYTCVRHYKAKIRSFCSDVKQIAWSYGGSMSLNTVKTDLGCYSGYLERTGVAKTRISWFKAVIW